jgi:hypothetical protein
MSARIRAGSKFKRFLCFVLIDVRSFRVSPKMSSLALEVHVPEVENHCYRVYDYNKLVQFFSVTTGFYSKYFRFKFVIALACIYQCSAPEPVWTC